MMYIAVLLGVLGLVLGSFVNALVWRLKTKRNWVSERSQCVHCHHTLAPLDLIPVISWVLLRGKCRYCKKPISVQYPLVELATAALFVASYVWWPTPLTSGFQILDFSLWLLALVILMALFVYDLRWFILPDKLTYPLIAIGLIDGIIRIVWVNPSAHPVGLLELAYGLLPIAGLYGFLFFVSKGQWVGLGDAKLGAFIGLVLGWQGALLVLILANFLGLLVILPGLLMQKITRSTRVPFGPFLIVAFIAAGLFGGWLIDWYIANNFLI